ncbi:G-protein coupled receptor Mth2 isoform X2 [Eurytemora carolleeae]|nr:G-protein coupled receptor Mth2 isoform X2 [Eurytemora carolleeae]|eukprot:XP_023338127.1 G-protein coupled receptor Mth2-like isoform X2 [Eurytemora affinis]
MCRWKLEVYACSCSSPRDVAVTARKQLSEVPICCPVDSYLEISVSNTFKCVQETKNMEDLFEFPVSTPNCTWTNRHEFEVIDLEKVNQSSDIFCVGAVKQHGESVYQIRGIQCRLVCDGKTPCVRRCGNNGTWWDDSGWSIDQTPEEKDYFKKNNIHVEYGIVSKDPMMDMMILYPLGSCLDKFILDVNSSSLYLPARNTTLHYGEFCLAPRNPGNRKGGLFLQANMLLEESSGKVQKYQAYILLISVVCLIITIIVYSVLPVMLNNYFKIMLNFAISMLAGFLSLTAVKMKPWFAHEYSVATCKFLGYFNQFFLIAMFTWMTMMSYEIFKQIKGLKQKIGRGNLKQLTKKLMVGYGVPFLIVFSAVVVDFSAEGTEEDCGLLRPKFGIRFCTFNNRDDKFFWLLLPILIMLILNTLMFIYIVTEICRNASVRNDFRSGGVNRKEQIDKMLLYLRLFFGMGFVWYFEILSFLLDTPNSDWTWFPDTLNMLQGVWVFITFVCKRNVLNIIMKKKDRLYVSLRRSTIGDNGEIKVKLSEIRGQK